MKQFYSLIFLLLAITHLSLGGEVNDDTHEDEGHEYTVHVEYEDIYDILVFLITAYVAGLVTKSIGMPPLVGEIVAGFMLGPPFADYVPFAPALVLIGEIGLIALILEAGIELDVVQLRQTGTKALAIGFTGSMLPLLTGIGIGIANGEDFKGALAIGASFSPTSLGVAASALSSGGMHNTPVGQLIVASCVIDDVLGLILLSMFQVLVKDDPKIIEYFIPLISSFGFLIVLGYSGITWIPRMIQDKYLPLFPKKFQEMAMFGLLAAFCMAYLPLLNYTKASYLTGAFLAGATFSQLPDAHHSFLHNTHQVMEWLLRVFFAATIGFQVPVELFNDTYVIGMGFLLYACVAVKFPLGFYVPRFEDSPKDDSIYDPYKRDVLVTGLSMTCRGEFSFIIAAFALSEGVIEPKMYAAVVWAVLLSATTSPFILLNAIEYFKGLQDKHLELTNPMKAGDGDGKMPLHFHIHIQTKSAWGLFETLTRVMHDLNLEIVDHRTSHTRGLDPLILNDIFVKDGDTRIDLPTVAAQKAEQDAVRHVSSNDLVELAKQMSKSNELGEEPVDLSETDKRSVRLVSDLFKVDSMTVNRRMLIEKRLIESMSEIDTEVTELKIQVWNPWDWSSALDSMILMSNQNRPIDESFFMDIFDKIDIDGGGTVDEDELYRALKTAGVNITKDGLSAMMAMVDENGDGEISREEWRDAINVYLDQKQNKSFRHLLKEGEAVLSV